LVEQLNAFLNRIGQKFTEGWYEIRTIQQWMIDEIERKRVQYPFFKKKILFSWVSFNKKKTKKKKLVSQPSWFYYKRLDEFFRFFLKNMFPFLPDKRLELVGIDGQVVNNGDLFFEYKYFLTEKEYHQFIDFKECFNHPDHPHIIISYIFNLVIMIFGKLMLDITGDSTQISMLCADMKKDTKGRDYIQFIITTRPNEMEFLSKYLRTEIFHFSQRLPNIPKKVNQRLRNQVNLLYKLALREYPNANQFIPTVFLTILKKCLILQECTPILDILNFICSRIEDSVFNTKELVREILTTKFKFSKPIQKDFEDIFDFFNKLASLFSTFQSNNRAFKDRQYHLFNFYLQYFCAGGFDMMFINPAFFFPKVLKKAYTEEKLEQLYPRASMDVLNNFLKIGRAHV
jgi:hypothetical protein